MSKKKKIVVICSAVLMFALVSIGTALFVTYRKARRAADALMLEPSNGRWSYSHGAFIMDFDSEGLLGIAGPRWVFRYKDQTTGQESKRIYVRMPEYETYVYKDILDPVPVFGFLP